MAASTAIAAIICNMPLPVRIARVRVVYVARVVNMSRCKFPKRSSSSKICMSLHVYEVGGIRIPYLLSPRVVSYNWIRWHDIKRKKKTP